MWLNQRTIDGIRVMGALSTRWPRLTKAQDVADETTITLMNVQKTVNALAQAGLIITERGRRGGMMLSRPSSSISIGDIVRVFEPMDCPVHFLMMSEMDAKISRLVFDAHKGFFRSLEQQSLAELAPMPVRSSAAQPAEAS